MFPLKWNIFFALKHVVLFRRPPTSCVSGGDETKCCDRAPEAEEDHDACREGGESEVCVQFVTNHSEHTAVTCV